MVVFKITVVVIVVVFVVVVVIDDDVVVHDNCFVGTADNISQQQQLTKD